MEIFYCEKCTGKPYTKNLKDGIKCPVCGTILKCEDVNEEALNSRPAISSQNKGLGINSLISLKKNSQNNFTNSFMISAGEKYYIYLGIRKTGKLSFACRFIFGNTPDRHGIITKTPIVSSKFSFEKCIELSVLESKRKQFEEYILSDEWEADESLYHVYYRLTEIKKVKKVFVLQDVTMQSEEQKASQHYFIEYMQPDYDKISVFSKSEGGFINSVRKVHQMHNESYMQCMYFRSKNGDVRLGLGSFADSSALLFDDPYTSLIRYDRIMKEIKMPRI